MGGGGCGERDRVCVVKEFSQKIESLFASHSSLA